MAALAAVDVSLDIEEDMPGLGTAGQLASELRKGVDLIHSKDGVERFEGHAAVEWLAGLVRRGRKVSHDTAARARARGRALFTVLSLHREQNLATKHYLDMNEKERQKEEAIQRASEVCPRVCV